MRVKLTHKEYCNIARWVIMLTPWTPAPEGHIPKNYCPFGVGWPRAVWDRGNEEQHDRCYKIVGCERTNPRTCPCLDHTIGLDLVMERALSLLSMG